MAPPIFWITYAISWILGVGVLEATLELVRGRLHDLIPRSFLEKPLIHVTLHDEVVGVLRRIRRRKKLHVGADALHGLAATFTPTRVSGDEMSVAASPIPLKSL